MRGWVIFSISSIGLLTGCATIEPLVVADPERPATLTGASLPTSRSGAEAVGEAFLYRDSLVIVYPLKWSDTQSAIAAPGRSKLLRGALHPIAGYVTTSGASRSYSGFVRGAGDSIDFWRHARGRDFAALSPQREFGLPRAEVDVLRVSLPSRIRTLLVITAGVGTVAAIALSTFH